MVDAGFEVRASFDIPGRAGRRSSHKQGRAGIDSSLRWIAGHERGFFKTLRSGSAENARRGRSGAREERSYAGAIQSANRNGRDEWAGGFGRRDVSVGDRDGAGVFVAGSKPV